MRLEQVTSGFAQGWEYVRRLTARQWADCHKAVSELGVVEASIRFVATCVCDKDGKCPWATMDQAIATVGDWDWQLVRDIDQQATQFNGFGQTVEDAKKN